MTTAAKTTAKFALISFEAYGRNARIVAVGSEATMLDRHADTPIGGGTFYSVRPVDHELALDAAKAEAATLGPREAKVLATFAKATEAHNWVKPGSRKSRTETARWDRAAAVVGLERAWDYTGTARQLQAKGLLRIDQNVAYSPASYRVTMKGRMIAAAL